MSKEVKWYNVYFQCYKDEPIFATISIIKEILSTFEEALDSITNTNVSIFKERMQALCHQ